MSTLHWAGHLLWILFGPGTWGSGGNMVAWVICGAMGFTWLRGKEKARTALAARHHGEAMAQAERHHAAALEQAAAQHRDVAGKLSVHCADIKEHVTAAVAADAQVSGGAGSNPATAGLPADQRVVPPPAATGQVTVPQEVLDTIRTAQPPGGDPP